MQISTQPKSTADNPSEPSTQDTPVLPNATTTATAVTAATTEKTKKRRNQCPVRHWYREGLQLRRGIITVPIDVSTVLYEPCNDVQQQQQQQQQQEGTAAPPPPPIATTTTTIDEPNSYLSRLPLAHPRQKVTDADFGASQMSVVRDFCRENEGTSFHPRQVGYIYAEKSVSGQVAAPPSEYDKYGLPTDHLKFPVVVSFENHWYLPCSLNDKCRIHHDLL